MKRLALFLSVFLALVIAVALILVPRLRNERKGSSEVHKLSASAGQTGIGASPSQRAENAAIAYKSISGPLLDALSLKESKNRTTALLRLEDGFGNEQDVLAGLTAWKQITVLKEADALLKKIINEWSKWDPASAATWVAINANDLLAVNRLYRSLMIPAVRMWAEEDPSATLNFIEKHAKPRSVPFLYSALFSAWAENDPRSAANKLGECDLDGATLGRAWGEVMRKWSEVEPVGAVEFAVSCPENHPARGALNRILSRIAAEDPAMAMNIAEGLPEGDRKMGFSSAFQRWMVADSRAALAYLHAHSEHERDLISRPTLAVLAETDAELALELSANLSEEERYPCINSILYSWSRVDPRAAWNYAIELGEDAIFSSTIARVVGHLADEDRAYALEQAGRIPDENVRADARTRILRSWARSNPDEVLAYLNGQDELQGDVRKNVLMGVALAYAGRGDHEKAFEMARDMEDAGIRKSALLSVAHSLAARDPAGFLDRLPSWLSDDIRGEATVLAATRLRTRDPAGAVTYAQSISDEKLRHRALDAIFAMWVNDDPYGALEALERMEEYPGAESVRGQAMVALLEFDKDRAMRVTEDLEDETVRMGTALSIAGKLAETEPSEAVRWYREIAGESPAYARNLKRLLQIWAWERPEGNSEAADWILDQGTDHPPEVLDVFLERLARADISKAYEFALSVQDEEKSRALRDKAFSMTIREMAEVDGRKAMDILESAEGYEPEPDVVKEVVFNWAEQDPKAAAEWVAALPEDDPNRSQAITDVYFQWRRVNPLAATAWREEMSFSGK